MNIRLLITCIFCVFISGFIAHTVIVGSAIYGDGKYYFSWVRSLAIGTNFDFTDEYKHFSLSQPLTAAGIPGNKYAIGPALIWILPYMAAHTSIGGTGYELAYQMITGFISILCVVTGLILLYMSLLRFFPNYISTLALLSVSICTNLWFYGSLDPINSHAVSFFISSLYLTFLIGMEKPMPMTAGITLGILALIRPQDAILSVVAFGVLPVRQYVRFAICACIGFLPQLFIWQGMYHSIFTSPYISGGEFFDFLHPHIIEVLFQLPFGIVTATPLLVSAFYGIFKLHTPRYPKLGIFIFLALCMEVYAIASWSTWWQGATYGSRMFIATLPFCSFGIAQTLVILRSKISTQWIQASVFMLGILNAVFIFAFLSSN